MTKQELKKLNGELWSMYCEANRAYKDITVALLSIEEKLKLLMRVVAKEVTNMEKEDGDNETLS